MSDDLKDMMALRLARLSVVMGLDDEDELLLWRYIAGLVPGEKLDPEIMHVLSNLAEESPHLVTSYRWKASMPSRFYNDKQRKLSRVGFSLKSSDQVRLSTPMVVNDIEHFKDAIADKCRRNCFVEWFDRITACLREDGVNWEPPADRDVELELTVSSLELREHLRQFM